MRRFEETPETLTDADFAPETLTWEIASMAVAAKPMPISTITKKTCNA